ncbi:helix-turn-helix transcriptional regulator [Weissella confusa]|uniref:helix-turn-helix domain-containing protein n=1 Tax=Weissella confusa TaxID=1583 RepID=UPI0016805773|nr:helix-turn-helix transcriptional regulator [Weissella confusa]MBD1490970.1 XRE family transcriptional regulator [Weissella confusa]MBJ7662954.1 helix-turn-helix transcriptional regulator [Weissella confusa]
MGTQNLAERINEIRAEKNITIDEIEAAGVSRSQYYRFIRGEASLTAVELWHIETLFSISFSELMDGVAEKPYQLNIGELAQLPDADLIRERERIMAAYDEQHFPLGMQVMHVINIILARRQGIEYSDDVKALYDDFRKLKSFSLFEMRVTSLIGIDLTPKRFLTLYQKFIESVQVFQDYMPRSLFETSLMIHMTAIQLLIIKPRIPKVANVWLILTAIKNHPVQDSNVELLVLKRYGYLIATFLKTNSMVTEAMIATFLLAARQMGVETLQMNFVSISLTDAWRKIQDKISQLHAQSLSPVDDIMYDQLSFKPISQTFGELMHQTVRDKGISINRLTALGFSKSKMYRLYDDSQALMVNDMLDLMRIGGLETGDLDPLLTMLPNKGLDVRYNLYGVQQHMLVETAEELRQKYAQSGHIRDLEGAYELETIVRFQHDTTWIASDDAKVLAKEVADLLRHIDEWHENEYRLVKIGLMDVTEPEELGEWLRRIRHDGNAANHTRVYTDRLIDAVEFAIFRALFEGDWARVETLVTNAIDANPKREESSRYTAWRWRMASYEIYRRLSDNPVDAIRELYAYYTNYEVLLGPNTLVDRYISLFDNLWRQYR